MKKQPKNKTRVLELSRETIRLLSLEESLRIRGGLCLESDSFCETHDTGC